MAPGFHYHNICRNSNPNDNLRVLMIFTRVGDFWKRDVLRRTYFPIFQNKANGFNYIPYFALARPYYPNITALIHEEIREHNDVVVFNVEEGYRISTFKLLSGMASVSSTPVNIVFVSVPLVNNKC